MKEITFKDSNGTTMNISVIGFFRIPELQKEFINDEGHVILGEVIRENDEMKILGIESGEKDLVLAYYNEVSNQIGGSENE